MAKTDEVPVFYRDQDEVCERPAKIWLRSECREHNKVSGRFFNNGKAFRLFSPSPKIYAVSASSLRPQNVVPAASTISFSELQANVGIAGPKGDSSPAPRHLVRNAQAKIKAYPFVHDTQAVLAANANRGHYGLVVSVVQ